MKPEALSVLAVIDDEELAADLAALLPGDIRLRWTRGSVAAVAELLRESPQVLLVDLLLEPFYGDSSVLEGLALIRTIRQHIDAQLPIIAIVSDPSDDLCAELRAVGVKDCLSKPLDLDGLFHIMSSFSNLQRGS
ncbi:MAG: response regulator [Candidatus Eisenbacteria sp.]|nr:response regulator [Candidatus Eisenbacteria bacterium]